MRTYDLLLTCVCVCVLFVSFATLFAPPVQSAAFAKFQPKWGGILAAAPQSKQYAQRIL